MALATLEDINVHLPADKLEALAADSAQEQQDAQRIVIGELSATFSAVTLAGWTDPTQTNPASAGYVPGYIHAVAGRLIAAMWYARAFSVEALGVDSYAQGLYNEAMAMLQKIKDGTIILTDVTEVVDTGTRFTNSMYLPETSDPIFVIGAKF